MSCFLSKMADNITKWRQNPFDPEVEIFSVMEYTKVSKSIWSEGRNIQCSGIYTQVCFRMADDITIWPQSLFDRRVDIFNVNDCHQPHYNMTSKSARLNLIITERQRWLGICRMLISTYTHWKYNFSTKKIRYWALSLSFIIWSAEHWDWAQVH